MADISVLSIDIAKNIFEFCGKTSNGRVVLRKKLSRGGVLAFLAQQKSGTVVAMEACGGSHYWGRECRKLTLEPRLIAPQFVKPFVKSNKHNRADSEAIGEAALRPTMRFVPVKSIQQQDTLAVHRVRPRLVKQRTALINEMRGLLHEYGVIIAKGAKRFRIEFCAVIQANKEKLSSKALELFNNLWDELRGLDVNIEKYEKSIENEAKTHPVSKKLTEQVPGIGPITANALVAAVGDPTQFKNGREFAAW
jgi:transposase